MGNGRPKGAYSSSRSRNLGGQQITVRLGGSAAGALLQYAQHHELTFCAAAYETYKIGMQGAWESYRDVTDPEDGEESRRTSFWVAKGEVPPEDEASAPYARACIIAALLAEDYLTADCI